MEMAAKLNWGEWKFKRGGGPIEFRVAGNPDTAVAIKFFLYVSDKDKAAEEVVCEEFQPYAVDPAKVNGSVNRLGFIFIATPTLAGGKGLFAWVEARQRNGEDHRQDYQYTLTGSQVDLTMTDGVTLAF